MNILFDCHTFDAGPQGTTTFLAGLLDALPAAAEAMDRPVTLTCAARDPAAIARFVDVPHCYRPVTGGFALRNMVKLPRLTLEPGIDAVVSQYVRPFRSAVPTVSVIHDVLFLDYPALFGWHYRVVRQALFGWAARHSTAVITVSDYSRNRIAHHFGLPAERIDVLPNAVDVRAPLTAPIPRAADAPLRLLYVSRFETRKRQRWCVLAADAIAAAGGRAVELTLVGNAQGNYADAVRAHVAERCGGGASVVVRSDVPQAELDAIYAATDLFLFPSQCEGFGIPVIEAAAHGVPCIVAANTAMRELAGTYAGTAVEADDETAFAAAAVAAADRLSALRDEALVLAPRTRSAYRWSDVARDFLSILDRRGLAR